MFFSFDTRPTYSRTGRGYSVQVFGRGGNSVRSTPRDQRRRLRNPRAARSASSVGVETMTADDAEWNQRMKRYVQPAGTRASSCRYSGNLL